MTIEKPSITDKPIKPKSEFMKQFEMKEDESIEEEHDDHVHVEGCCSCHSNVGE